MDLVRLGAGVVESSLCGVLLACLADFLDFLSSILDFLMVFS